MGGKQKLCRRIVALLPEARLYVEPFTGMAAVYMAREPISRVNILNDQDKQVVNFLRVNRDEPDALAA